MLIISPYSSPGIYQTLYGPWRYFFFFASILRGSCGPQFSPLLLYFRGGRAVQGFSRKGSRLVWFECWPHLFPEV